MLNKDADRGLRKTNAVMPDPQRLNQAIKTVKWLSGPMEAVTGKDTANG